MQKKYFTPTEDSENGKSYRNISSPDKTYRQKCPGLILEDAAHFQLVRKSAFSLVFLSDFPVVKQRNKWVNLVLDLKNQGYTRSFQFDVSTLQTLSKH